jgi:radical SAM superfamily enzyme YgiQ (UPF0313 family)
MYKNVKYRVFSFAEIKKSVANAAKYNSGIRRIFLADGDVMSLPFDKLSKILQLLNSAFQNLSRVNIYANGNSILSKNLEQLAYLKNLKLNTLYMGLESGDNETLSAVKKRETSEGMIVACQKAQAAGLRMSVMILTGLGGETNSDIHAKKTSAALNKMQPRLLSALRVIPIPGTELYESERKGIFNQLTEFSSIEELRGIIERLELTSCIFRANHSSNILPLEGRFPKDKKRILTELDLLLKSGKLSKTSPAEAPFWL